MMRSANLVSDGPTIVRAGWVVLRILFPSPMLWLPTFELKISITNCGEKSYLYNYR